MSNLTELTKKMWVEYFTGEEESVLCLLNMFQENSSIIGTGKHEFYNNLQDFKKAVSKELLERKNIRFQFDEFKCEEMKITEEISLVYGSMAIWWKNDERTIEIDMDSRFSVLYQKQSNGGWKILHIHLSTPNCEQISGDFYPKTLIEQVETANEKIKSLTKLASADSLTGLINLRTLKEKYKKFRKKDSWLFVIDIDNFKEINDKYGHLKGDAVLIELSHILTATIRKNDLVCRMGGDEFILLCSGIKTETGAGKLAERLLANVAKNSGKNTPVFAVSAGLTRVVEGEAFEEAFIRADRALYTSKRAGKGNFSIEYRP